MRIGIMLRALDEFGGIAIYTRYITEELLALDRRNEYVLYYRTPAHLGRFASLGNVVERLLPAPNKIVWDQVTIPLACRRDAVDVIFHPKFTVPLLAPCPSAMTLHGADYFVAPHAKFYGRFDVAFSKRAFALYIRRAAAVFSVSQLTTDNMNAALRLAPGKIITTYWGPARHFHRVTDPTVLRTVRERYRLPEQFIFTITKRLGNERKNLGTLLEAYRRMHGTIPHQLVIGGKDCELFRGEYGLPDAGYGKDIHFTGWIAQEDLPAVYSMASLYLYPSNLEAFPIPITEAMACGTPIVTSDANGLSEIAGDAALLVDPADPEAIANAAGRVLRESTLAEELRARGLARVGQFSVEQTARRTLEVLERLGGPAEPVAIPRSRSAPRSAPSPS